METRICGKFVSARICVDLIQSPRGQISYRRFPQIRCKAIKNVKTKTILSTLQKIWQKSSAGRRQKIVLAFFQKGIFDILNILNRFIPKLFSLKTLPNPPMVLISEGHSILGGARRVPPPPKKKRPPPPECSQNFSTDLD